MEWSYRSQTNYKKSIHIPLRRWLSVQERSQGRCHGGHALSLGPDRAFVVVGPNRALVTVT